MISGFPVHTSEYILEGKLVQENWYRISGFSRYQVSDLGRVKRVESFRQGSYSPEYVLTSQQHGSKERCCRIFDDTGKRVWVDVDDLLRQINLAAECCVRC